MQDPSILATSSKSVSKKIVALFQLRKFKCLFRHFDDQPYEWLFQEDQFKSTHIVKSIGLV